MYIEGSLKSGKTSMLISRFIELINSDVSSSEILVICANSYKKNKFIENIKRKLLDNETVGIGNFPVYTFNGIVYNSILNNWCIIEEIISKKNDLCSIIPNLCGLETTEYILKLCINEINKRPKKISDSFLDYNSSPNLIHQLLRRYGLIIENCLLDNEIKEKSVLLGEQFYTPASEALKKLKNKTLELRSFDYLKQASTFLYLLENDFRFANDFNKIKYLFVDDMDEMSYSAQSFLRYLIPRAKECYLASDPDGGSRRGYLNAYPDGLQEIKKLKEFDLVKLTNKKLIYDDAVSLFSAIKFENQAHLENIELYTQVKKAEMLENALSKTKELLDNNTLPEDIIIVTPAIDEGIKHCLEDFFEKENISYQFLAGNKKLTDDPLVFSGLIILQLINTNWNLKPTVLEIRALFMRLLKFPITLCEKIVENYKKHKNLNQEICFDIEEFDTKYKSFVEAIELIKDKELSLYGQLIEIFSEIITPEIDEEQKVNDFNMMLKSLDNFLNITNMLSESEKPQEPEKSWIVQIKNTVVSDNPPLSPDIEINSVIIATPQKIVDFELESKYQIWLDVSGFAWTKDDTGPLYNSWVFQKNWGERKYTSELHKELTLGKTAHLLRKLVLCAKEKIFAYASQLNSTGGENTGFLHEYLDKKPQKSVENFKLITPREDQKPVVEYTGGKMAVPAVPGAGKTTIMQALIIELIKKNVRPSEILVLTYMESAARLFQDKIKRNCPNLNELPYISTIHGLAYKIIQDEDNFVKLGLDSDFSLCSEVDRSRILQEICFKHLPIGEDFKEWSDLNSRAVSRAKLGNLSYLNIKQYLKNNSSQQLEEFLAVYKDYETTLKSKNQLDFDGLLVMAVKLLKEYPEIKKYYQKQFRYILEDEAQDSSKIQQELISMISDHHGNLVRCGDVNQSIMSFSNADVKGFRNFIENNYKVEMSSSQRCAKEIYELANYLIDWTKSQDYLKNAFYDIKMQPVTKTNTENNCINGVCKNTPLNFNIFENSIEEKNWILNEITKFQSINPEFTIGILVNTNNQAIEWANYLEKNNIKSICFVESLKQKKVFRFLSKFLEIIENPWNNKLLAELLEEFIELKIYPANKESIDFIKNKAGSPFISFNPIDLENENLVKFWWEVYHWLENSCILPEELVLKLGYYYFDNIIDRSNVHLLAALVKKFRNNPETDLSDITKYLRNLLAQKSIKGIKVFDEMDEDARENTLGGYVQIMTVHKSKGNEFDVVFLPEMYENQYSYGITPENIKMNTENILIKEIDKIIETGKNKTEFAIKLELIEEKLRLLYVAVTRAKNYLYMSSSYKKSSPYGKNKFFDAVPSTVLGNFCNDFNDKILSTNL